MNKIKIILNNLSHGANKMGIESGMSILYESNENLFNSAEVIYTKLLKEDFGRKNLKFLNTVVDTCKKISNSTNKSVKENKFPLTIGGDHSIALGSISGIAKEVEDLGIFWVDAHGDMNTDKISETGHIHGMPLAALLGLGAKELVSFLNKDNRIKSQHVVLFGIRDLDLKEKELIEKKGIKVYYYKDIEKIGFQNCLSEASDYLLKNTKNLHISFDLDSINPKLIPGVSTPVVDGFSIKEGKEIVKYLFEKHQMKSMDIVEYNPLYDIDKNTLKFLKDLINIVKEKVES